MDTSGNSDVLIFVVLSLTEPSWLEGIPAVSKDAASYEPTTSRVLVNAGKEHLESMQACARESCRILYLDVYALG